LEKVVRDPDVLGLELNVAPLEAEKSPTTNPRMDGDLHERAEGWRKRLK
jgi:hypothetical protein